MTATITLAGGNVGVKVLVTEIEQHHRRSFTLTDGSKTCTACGDAEVCRNCVQGAIAVVLLRRQRRKRYGPSGRPLTGVDLLQTLPEAEVEAARHAVSAFLAEKTQASSKRDPDAHGVRDPEPPRQRVHHHLIDPLQRTQAYCHQQIGSEQVHTPDGPETWTHLAHTAAELEAWANGNDITENPCCAPCTFHAIDVLDDAR